MSICTINHHGGDRNQGLSPSKILSPCLSPQLICGKMSQLFKQGQQVPAAPGLTFAHLHYSTGMIFLRNQWDNPCKVLITWCLSCSKYLINVSFCNGGGAGRRDMVVIVVGFLLAPNKGILDKDSDCPGFGHGRVLEFIPVIVRWGTVAGWASVRSQSLASHCSEGLSL